MAPFLLRILILHGYLVMFGFGGSLVSRLVLIASAPVIDLGGGRVRLDTKFVEGMRLQSDLWGAPVTAMLWKGADNVPFGADYNIDALGFPVRLLDKDAALTAAMFDGYDIVAAAGDLHLALDLPFLWRGKQRPKIVYAIEYTLQTRLDIIRLDRDRGVLRKMRSALWTIRQERRREAAFRAADGVQANGFPAFKAFKGLNRQTILYLDNRMRSDMMATPQDTAARMAHRRGGGPIRLIHSGRLEPMKGAQDLVPLARALRKIGVSFTLDIYGAGSLAASIAQSVAAEGLDDIVRLHDPVDFETELAPIMRTRADLYVSCHRQADPSCSYLENMGCGLPVLGYRNAMWTALLADSLGGWSVPLGDVGAMGNQIALLANDPEMMAVHAANALSYAIAHDFRTEFAKRMDHLAMIAGPTLETQTTL